MARFLHTSDWQLGMTRHYLSEGSQERFTQARFDAIRKLGSVAKGERCEFLLVTGDVFESNYVDRRTVARTLEALKDVPVPVYLLPGNHDPLDAASFYRSPYFVDQKPSNVNVIENATPLIVAPGVEIVGAPWTSKHPAGNPIDAVLNGLSTAYGAIRVCAAHGAVDVLSPAVGSADIINISVVEKAIKEGKVHFVALGDRHSKTKVGSTERVWYSGTPEPADFGEKDSGYVLIVDVNERQVNTKPIQIAAWRFINEEFRIYTQEDIAALRFWLTGVKGKERVIARLTLIGSLSLSLHAELQGDLKGGEDLFGALDVRDDALVVTADDTDFAELGFSGFANETVKRLRGKFDEGGAEATAARDALLLLLSLTKEPE